MFLKLADKVDMDEISNKFENWPDRIVNLRVTSPWLLKKPLFDFVFSMSFSFDRMFLKLADKVAMHEISDRFENWPDRIINLKSYVPLIVEKASVWLSSELHVQF